MHAHEHAYVEVNVQGKQRLDVAAIAIGRRLNTLQHHSHRLQKGHGASAY